MAVIRGMDGTAVHRFATLVDVQTYVRGRWEGIDYICGLGDFHNDYGYFELSGCTLADLGARVGEWEWAWKDVTL